MDISKENLTTFLAVWGAALSSITFGWNLFRDLTQTGRLRISCYIGQIISAAGTDPRRMLCWSVTNVGREPIVLTHIGGGYKDDKEFLVIPSHPFPMTLKPGEYTIEYTDDLSVLGPRLSYLCAIDSLGRKFKAPWGQVRKLKKAHRIGGAE